MESKTYFGFLAQLAGYYLLAGFLMIAIVGFSEQIYAAVKRFGNFIANWRFK